MKLFRKFDRICRHDERSRQFPIMALIKKSVSPVTKIWDCSIVLDQGREGACTGFGTSHEGAAEPCVVPNITNETAKKLYYRARQLDDFPGEDYEGSTVIAAVKAACELGWYDEYRWAFSVKDLILALGHQGPAILGMRWYEGMSTPNSRNIIRPTGSLLGGHCICAIGYDLKTDMVQLLNSWGPKWGKNGRCWISRKDLAELARHDGEACIPVKRKGGV